VRDGFLYELDGRRPFPINRGPSAPETLLEVRAIPVDLFQGPDPLQLLLLLFSLLQDTAKVVQKLVDTDPENIQFNLVALVQQESS